MLPPASVRIPLLFDPGRFHQNWTRISIGPAWRPDVCRFVFGLKEFAQKEKDAVVARSFGLVAEVPGKTG